METATASRLSAVSATPTRVRIVKEKFSRGAICKVCDIRPATVLRGVNLIPMCAGCRSTRHPSVEASERRLKRADGRA